MSWSLIFFLLIGAVSLAAALGVVTSRQPVHSALFLLTNFATLAVLYITLDAQFLAAAQVIVYAGGIVILILFVIMLIGGDTNDFSAAQRAWSRTVGIALGIILLLVISYSALSRMMGPSEDTAALLQGGTPEAVGIELFTKYILPFELVALLLLVALIGALVLGRQQEGASEGIPTVKANE